MNLFENIVIISAELNSLDKQANYERTGMLRRELLELGLPFVGVKEYWKGETAPIQSFLVVTKYYKPLLELAQDFKQDSIMLSDNRRTTFQVYTHGTPAQKLGTLKRVSKEDTTAGSFYLLVNENGTDYYYTTTDA